MANPSVAQFAPYAVRSGGAGDRVHPEAADPLRGPFELDRHRIIESTAFRRLEHKTQVFAPAHHDHFRTRLTHTLEAAQIARCLAVGLRANEALAEAITLAHDLGHPPFGHAGEAALDEAMADHGGFNHNTHSLRVVDYLEHPFPPFRGLNLTAATRAGLVTHATPYDQPNGRPDAASGSSVEAQIASLADRIAYDCHDLEDAIGARFITLDDLARLQLWQKAHDAVTRGHEVAHIFAVRRAVLDALLDRLLEDVLETSGELLADVRSSAQAQTSPDPLVRPSADAGAQLGELELFLNEHVYRHPEVAEMDARGRGIVLALCNAYREKAERLPPRFAARISEQGAARVICDYIAGMTDRFCETEYARLVSASQCQIQKGNGVSSSPP